MAVAVVLFFFLCVRLANVRDHLALYLYWLNPAPGVSRLRARSPCHDSRGRGEGWRGGDGVGITFLQLWRWVHGACPTVKGGPGLACTLNCPVTMGTEEWERKWKSAPSGLHITPSAGTASWEAILNAYSAAAAVWVAVMCLKSRPSCLYSDPTVTSKKKELWKRSSPAQLLSFSHSQQKLWNSNQISVELNHVSPQGAI